MSSAVRTVVVNFFILWRVSSNSRNFFGEFYEVTLNAYSYKPLLAAMTSDHKGLPGPTSRNRQSCENLKISFENLLGKMRNIFWEPRF